MRHAADERGVFALLGVDEKTPWDEVRRAFRDAVRASHPDLHAGDPVAEQRLKLLNAAWESVNTPGKWAAYVASPPVGRLRIQRQRIGSAGLRRWKIELDGEVVANVENGGTIVLEARPGRHRIRVFYDWYSSLPLQVQLHAGQELHLGCRQQPGAFRSVTSPKRSLALELLAVK